nr:HNH endonuclease signature motif containing protein [Cryobacterium roopkundense]
MTPPGSPPAPTPCEPGNTCGPALDRYSDKPDGMLHGSFELDPENGAYFKDFLQQVIGPRTGGPRFVEKGEKERAQRIIDDPRSTDQIAAESLIEAIKVAAGADPGTIFGRIRPSVKLVVMEAPAPATPSSALEFLGDGFIEGTSNAATAATIDRALCDTGFTPVLFGRDGSVLDVGREQRLFTQPQRVALALRDGGCMWKDCLKPPSFSEAHHLHQWKADGGLTNLEDGILLCSPHHLRLHNEISTGSIQAGGRSSASAKTSGWSHRPPPIPPKPPST